MLRAKLRGGRNQPPQMPPIAAALRPTSRIDTNAHPLIG
jgi:hypothetical protein